MKKSLSTTLSKKIIQKVKYSEGEAVLETVSS